MFCFKPFSPILRLRRNIISQKFPSRWYSSGNSDYDCIGNEDQFKLTEKMDERIEEIKKHIKSFPDFPIKGILFRDIFSVLKEPQVFKLLRDVMVEHVRGIQPPVDSIVALESRGFLFGPILALELDLPCIPIRKKGKLPGQTKSVSYKLEYGEDIFEIQEGSIIKGQKVLVVDDLLATGGTLAASCSLVEKCEAQVSECLVVMELKDLKGREKISQKINSIVQF